MSSLRLVLTLAMALVPSLAVAAPIDRYVAPAGKDSDDGSRAHPWATLRHAAAAVTPGMVVHVAAGTYREAIRIDASGTAAARIRFLADARGAAKLTGRGREPTIQIRGDYVDIIGFDVTGLGYQGIENYASFGRIVANHVHDIPGGCPKIGGAGINSSLYGGHDNAIVANRVDHIGNGSGLCALTHGIYVANARNRVADNIVYRNQGWGITSWHAATNNRIVNNVVFGNDVGGINTGAGDEPGGVTDEATVVANNIVVDNGHHGGRSRYGIGEEGRTGTHNRYTNNLVFGNKPADYGLRNHGIAMSTSTIDPRRIFVDYRDDGTGNYHLAPASPAVDAGSPIDAPRIDFDGGARPRGRAVDIGAYELGAAPAVWPWPWNDVE